MPKCNKLTRLRHYLKKMLHLSNSRISTKVQLTIAEKLQDPLRQLRPLVVAIVPCIGEYHQSHYRAVRAADARVLFARGAVCRELYSRLHAQCGMECRGGTIRYLLGAWNEMKIQTVHAKRRSYMYNVTDNSEERNCLIGAHGRNLK